MARVYFYLSRPGALTRLPRRNEIAGLYQALALAAAELLNTRCSIH